MDILSLIGGSGALGGLFGAVGSGLGRLIGIYEMREKRQDRTLEMAHETALITQQMQARAADTDNALKLAAQALDRTVQEGSMVGLKASVDADAALNPYPWVEAVRALVRPVLTLLIWLIFSGLFFAALRAKLPTDSAGDVIATFVNTVTFSASTALAWWFGDRPRSSK